MSENSLAVLRHQRVGRCDLSECLARDIRFQDLELKMKKKNVKTFRSGS